jgi:hypothetical protein
MTHAIFNDVFGRLEWDNELGCWLGGIDWPPGLHTEVAIWHAGLDVPAGLRLAQEGLAWLHYQEAQARHSVAAAMLATWNESWRGEDDELSEDELAGQFELMRIGFVEDGSLLLTYDAGDLFGGQVVDGEFGPDRSFRGAGLVG